MKTISEEMDGLVDDMFETIAKATRPATQEMNKGLDDLGKFMDVQMDRLNSTKPKTYGEISELIEKWIDYIKSQCHDKDYANSFAIGWMKTTLLTVLMGDITSEDVISDMERLTRS